MYPRQFLVPTYRNLLHFSHGRGEHTLAKLDALLFNFPREVVISSDDNVSITLPPDPHLFRYLTKSHEQQVSNAIKKLVRNGDVVIDIGANVGYFSAYSVAAVGKQGQVFCFEPENQNFEILKANCEFMKLQGFNCSAYKFAASSVSGKTNLRVHRYSTYHAIEDSFQHLDKTEYIEEIDTVRLDEWAESQSIKRISLLKIDTEGHEPKVLEGSRKLFEAQAIDFVILECRSDQIGTFVDKFCKAFDLHQLVWDGHRWNQTNILSLNYRTECLLSIQPISPTLLC